MAPLYFLRLATTGDLPALRELIPLSVRALSREHYTSRQIESAIRYVFGPDTQLIADGTYFVTETAGARSSGCGGWSRRRTLCGGDQMKGTGTPLSDDDLLDPATDAARIRAFFVAPDWARRGVATHLMTACVDGGASGGISPADLGATLPGVAFYRTLGLRRGTPAAHDTSRRNGHCVCRDVRQVGPLHAA